jgi:hypothetical protein
VNPVSARQLLVHPVWLPLSQASRPYLNPSPQTEAQVDKVPIPPLQENPVSTLVQVVHPDLFPLSQASFDALILSSHTEVHTEAKPIIFVQVKPTSGTQLLEQPVVFPLSHSSLPPTFPSPQVILHKNHLYFVLIFCFLWIKSTALSQLSIIYCLFFNTLT